ncbi:MAG: hypothetical protein J6J44_13305, partial [Lachnospiraceae bacterium]|nr:hypothetical protein [Lachnospiraceae bacterium]
MGSFIFCSTFLSPTMGIIIIQPLMRKKPEGITGNKKGMVRLESIPDCVWYIHKITFLSELQTAEN